MNSLMFHVLCVENYTQGSVVNLKRCPILISIQWLCWIEWKDEFSWIVKLVERKIPSQRFWNKMDIMPVPPVLKNSSNIEQRMLTSIILFSKIVKVWNRCSQNWCKEQSVLFTQDVIDITVQLSLPLCNARLVIIVTYHKNLQQHREFQKNIERVRIGL